MLLLSLTVPVPGGGRQKFLLCSSAGTEAESPQLMALSSLPSRQPPSSCWSELRDSGSKRLAHRLGTMSPCHGNGMPGVVILS